MDLKTKSPKQASLIVLIVGVILILLVFAAAGPSTPFSNASVDSAADAVAFLATLGWDGDDGNTEVKQTVLPEEFDDVLTEYNKLQLEQGCDLTKYAGKEVTIYTVPITNYDSSGENVYATLIVQKGKVIGGDIHSAKLDGFMHTLQ